jgi:5-methylcytosine-specific restriction endonuclease McrA
MLNKYQALKLDAAYRPVGVIPSVQALVSLMLGKVYVLETHERLICSQNESFKLPSVVVLKNRVVRHHRTFSCTTKNLRIRDNGECQYCTKAIPLGRETVDHVIPKSKGGKHVWENIVLSCVACNQKKGSKTLAQAGLRLAKKPRQLDYKTYLEKVTANVEVWDCYLKR